MLSLIMDLSERCSLNRPGVLSVTAGMQSSNRCTVAHRRDDGSRSLIGFSTAPITILGQFEVCVYMCVCVCLCVCIPVCVLLYLCVWTPIYVCQCLHSCVCLFVIIRVYTYMGVSMHVRVYTPACVNVCVWKPGGPQS